MTGFVKNFGWMNKNVCKTQCRSLFWRIKAAVKKSHYNVGKKHVKFHYDPSSYALNFDDGGGGDDGGGSRFISSNNNVDDENMTDCCYRMQMLCFYEDGFSRVYICYFY
ncbi:hypothetical protein vseg_011392 [Gypsophila vaccaria]